MDMFFYEDLKSVKTVTELVAAFDDHWWTAIERTRIWHSDLPTIAFVETHLAMLHDPADEETIKIRFNLSFDYTGEGSYSDAWNSLQYRHVDCILDQILIPKLVRGVQKSALRLSGRLSAIWQKTFYVYAYPTPENFPVLYNRHRINQTMGIFKDSEIYSLE